MINIYFSGSVETENALKSALDGFAEVVCPPLASPSSAQGAIFEIVLVEDLKLLPQKPSSPLFVLLNLKNKSDLKNVVETLKNFKVAAALSLPVNPDAIKRKLAQARGIAPSFNADGFHALKVKILAKCETIASLPTFAQALLRLTQSDSSTVQEITAQIKSDQGISGKVISMINSSFFGLRQNVTSIDRAVVMLGFRTLKNIALVTATNAYYNKNFSLYNTTGQELWRHAYYTALIAEELASLCEEDVDELFLAGLLHDIGKVLLTDFLVKPVDSPLEEREQLGTDHAAISKIVLERWKVPAGICAIVQGHHDTGMDTPVRIVYCANLLEHASYKEDFDEILQKTLETLPLKDMFAVERIKKIVTNRIADDQAAH